MGTKRTVTSIEIDQKTHSPRKKKKERKKERIKKHTHSIFFCFDLTSPSLCPHAGLSASLHLQLLLIFYFFVGRERERGEIIPMSEYKAKILIPANLMSRLIRSFCDMSFFPPLLNRICHI